MVERLNRRLGEHLDRLPKNRAAHHRRFLSHAERDAYVLEFVANYNRARLKYLGHRAPLEVLSNPQGPNTFAVRALGANGAVFVVALLLRTRELAAGSR